MSTDFVVRIGYDEVEPEDIQMLRSVLNLTDPAVQAVFQFARRFGDRHWMEKVLSLTNAEEIERINQELNVHEGTFRNLRRGLEVLRRFPFMVPHAPDNSVEQILGHLDRGINVVLEFGRYTDFVAYVLVANLLSRRIYARYRERTEKAMGDYAPKPKPLVITIEEAHRFLDPVVAPHTIFGTIAREMRKYNVTLLVIDQRPSGIDEEVMSQLGTKVCCLLDNEKDVDSALAGVSGKSELRTILAKLESKQQALIFGHSVPVPVVVKTREYGPEFYGQVAARKGADAGGEAGDIEEMWRQ